MHDQSLLKAKYLDSILQQPISESDKELLNPIISYIEKSLQEKSKPILIFISKEASTLVQLARIWARVAAHYFDVEIEAYSASLNAHTIQPLLMNHLQEIGFEFEPANNSVKRDLLTFSKNKEAIATDTLAFQDNALPMTEAALITLSPVDDELKQIIDPKHAGNIVNAAFFDASDLHPTIQDEVEIFSDKIASLFFYLFSRFLGHK